MTARALRDHGALRDDAEILGVGAGQESTIFWLTRHVRRVFATDLYHEEDSWSETDSGPGMLVSPAWGAGQEWNPRRLVAQHMDGTRLNYEDAPTASSPRGRLSTLAASKTSAAASRRCSGC